MNRNYSDILSRISTPPLWFDDHACPRFEPFAPDMLDIYADEVALVGIECQGCGRGFKVAFSSAREERILDAARAGKAGEAAFKEACDATLAAGVRDLHYGDPPNVECCPAGPTMNSVPRQVLQFWRRVDFKWERVPSLEVAIDCDWADEEMADAFKPEPAAFSLRSEPDAEEPGHDTGPSAPPALAIPEAP